MDKRNLELMTLRVLIEKDDLDHAPINYQVKGYLKVARLEPSFLLIQYGMGASRESAIKDSIRIFESSQNVKVVSYDVVSDDNFKQIGM